MTALHVPRTAPDTGVIDAAKKALGDAILAVKEHAGEITLTVKREEIANVLKLSVYTVEAHRGKIMEKLNLHNTGDIVRFAVRKGLIS